MNLSTLTRQVALRQPDHPALLWEGAQLSYAGFEDQVARICVGNLARLGPGAQHRGLGLDQVLQRPGQHIAQDRRARNQRADNRANNKRC